MRRLSLIRKPKLLKFYRFVPPCTCGSWRTGYFVKGSVLCEKEILKALNRGEYIMFTNSDLSLANCFCADCGMEFYTEIKFMLLDKDAIAEQKNLRGIEEAKKNVRSCYEKERATQKEFRKKNRFINKVGKKVKQIVGLGRRR